MTDSRHILHARSYKRERSWETGDGWIDLDDEQHLIHTRGYEERGHGKRETGGLIPTVDDG